jgi:NAD(P)-dependent dehydrogenase (short-subunit alcohol dehydrogenase family)
VSGTARRGPASTGATPACGSAALPPDAEVSDLGRYATYPSLHGRVVLVTGGATGIGASIVAHFASQQSRVAFLDLLEGPGRQLCAALSRAGHVEPRFVPCDVRDVEQIRAVVDRVTEELGPIAVLVNNAAHDLRQKSAALTPEEWDEAMDVNLRAYFFVLQAVAPHMRRAGAGSVINLGSVSAHADFVDLAPYISAKAAIEGLTRTMARELGPDGIRVNCVVPGWVMTERQRANWVRPETLQAIERAQSLKISLSPADVARLVCWLAADDSRACSGQRWIVDGGWI